jgi:hypothetical protein
VDLRGEIFTLVSNKPGELNRDAIQGSLNVNRQRVKAEIAAMITDGLIREVPPLPGRGKARALDCGPNAGKLRAMITGKRT